LTNSIRERASALKVKLEKLHTARQTGNIVSALSPISDDLRTAKEELLAAREKLNLLIDSGVPYGKLGLNLGRTKDILTRLIAIVNDDATKIKRGRDLDSLFRRVEELNDSIEQCAIRSWVDYVQAKDSVLDEDLVKAISAVGIRSKEFKRYSVLKAMVRNAREEFPRNREKIEKFNGDSAELTKLAPKLVIDVDPEVKDFLVELQSDSGAGVPLYTEKVRAWCEEMDLEKRLRVKLF